MSTRATIACKQDDGRYAAIYLHFDGYQDHAGRVLKQNYTSIESAQTLVAGGDIRSLANDGTPERFTDGNRTVVMPTRAALHEFARNCGTEYVYVFEDDAWHCHKF
jgi:type 1 fimbria pilin